MEEEYEGNSKKLQIAETLERKRIGLREKVNGVFRGRFERFGVPWIFTITVASCSHVQCRISPLECMVDFL